MGVTVRGKSIIFNIDIDSGVYISNMNIPDIIYKNKSKIVEIIFNINYSENIRKIMPNIEQNINSIIKNLIEGLSKLDITDITLILSFSENPILDIGNIIITNKNNVYSKLILDFSDVYHEVVIDNLDICGESKDKSKCSILLSNSNNIIRNLKCKDISAYILNDNINIEKLTLNSSDILIMDYKSINDMTRDAKSNIIYIIKTEPVIGEGNIDIDIISNGIIRIDNTTNKYTLYSIDTIPFDISGKLIYINTTKPTNLYTIFQTIINVTDKKKYKHIMNGTVVEMPWIETDI